MGATVGGGWGSGEARALSNDTVDTSGLIGGLHAGYNWQFGDIVAGLEVDAMLSGIEGSRTWTGPARVDISYSRLASTRARLGYAWGNMLLYGTAGIGFGDADLRLSAGGLSATRSGAQVGYVAGGGVEIKFAPNISARVEALHYGFNEQTYSFPGGNLKADSDVTTVRAGISVHLN